MANPSRPRPPAASQAEPPGTAPLPAARTPGEVLRAARLRRRISLAEAEQATRIRQRYLEALEDDDYAALPAGVYSWGFLRNYAIYLGVPPEDVMPHYRGRRDRHAGLRRAAPPLRVSAPRTIWLLAVGGLVALTVVALAWLGLSTPEEAAPAGAPAATATALVRLPPLASASAPTAAAPTAQPTAAPSPSPARQVDVELRALERSWVRATVDGRVVLEETLAAGQTRRWTGQQSVLIRTGNGGGVEVTHNGQPIGALGPRGQIIDREFTR